MAKKKKKVLQPSLIVTQSNRLVEARYNLPLGEMRLILAMIARIQPDDEDFKEYRIDVMEFADFLGIARNSAYRELDRITTTIMTRVLVFEESDGPLKIGWVSSAKYLDQEGAVLLCFDPKLKPYLLQIKGNFTSSKLDMLLGFKSQYTVRVYNLLKQYAAFGEREIEINLLREILGLHKNQYTRYNDFKKDVLDAAQRELFEKADLTFEFDEIKYGRRVGAIHFRIFTQKLAELPPAHPTPHLPPLEALADTPLDQLMDLIPEPHRSKKTIKIALDAFEKTHGFDYVKRNILYSNAKAEKSYGRFLDSALKNDWGHDWALDQQDTPTKIRVLEVWERQGFVSEKAYNDFMYRKQMESYGLRVE